MTTSIADPEAIAADEHATRLYFASRGAGVLPQHSQIGAGGWLSYYDLPVVGGERRYPGMSQDVYQHPWLFWPYNARRAHAKPQ